MFILITFGSKEMFFDACKNAIEFLIHISLFCTKCELKDFRQTAMTDLRCVRVGRPRHVHVNGGRRQSHHHLAGDESVIVFCSLV